MFMNEQWRPTNENELEREEVFSSNLIQWDRGPQDK